MHVIVDFCLVPLLAGAPPDDAERGKADVETAGSPSLTPYIAECQRIIDDMGLDHQLHAYGTNISGEWDVVMDAVKRCHHRVHEMGAPRITSTIKLGTRVDRAQTMSDKVEHVRQLLDD